MSLPNGYNSFPDAQFYHAIMAGAQATGSVFYVHSGTGTDGAAYGAAPDAPFKSIDYAVGKCTANKGDVIMVLPGHNEGITTAANIDLDVAGISVIGLGVGSLKPIIDFDAAAASFAVGANNILVKNLRFRTSANTVVVGLDVEAGKTGAQILNCEFGWAETSTDEFNIALRLNAGCNDALVQGNLFSAGAQAAVAAISLTGASDNVVIRENRFLGNHSTAMVNGITAANTNLLIERNLFYQGATEPAIELFTGTTGIVRDNDIKTNLAAMINSVVGDAVFLFRNYYNEDVNPGTGTIFGTASADDQ